MTSSPPSDPPSATKTTAESTAVGAPSVSDQNELIAALRAELVALRARYHLVASVVDNSPSIIFAKDVEGRYTLVNKGAVGFFGVPQEQIVGKRDGAFFPPDVTAAIVATDLEIMASGEAVTFEEEVPKDGGSLIALTVKFPIYDESGAIAGICGVSTDVTAHRRGEVERTVLQEQVIEAQQATLDELSTPLIPIAAGVLVMPIVGSIDNLRAEQILETLLEGIVERRAHTAILDITGVRVVDTLVASGLVGAARAVRLLGARVLLTGIRPEVARILVELDADLTGVVTLGTLESGIAYALGR